MKGRWSSSPLSSRVARISSALRTSTSSPARRSRDCSQSTVVGCFGWPLKSDVSGEKRTVRGSLFGERTRIGSPWQGKRHQDFAHLCKYLAHCSRVARASRMAGRTRVCCVHARLRRSKPDFLSHPTRRSWHGLGDCCEEATRVLRVDIDYCHVAEGCGKGDNAAARDRSSSCCLTGSRVEPFDRARP